MQFLALFSSIQYIQVKQILDYLGFLKQFGSKQLVDIVNVIALHIRGNDAPDHSGPLSDVHLANKTEANSCLRKCRARHRVISLESKSVDQRKVCAGPDAATYDARRYC